MPEGRRSLSKTLSEMYKSRQSAPMSRHGGFAAGSTRSTVSTSEFYDAVRASLRNDPRVGLTSQHSSTHWMS